MNEEEAREIIDNMSEQELNDFIFFALQEVEKENQKLKTELEKKDIDIIEAKEANRQLSVELQKKDKIIDEIEDLCIRKGDDEGEEYGRIYEGMKLYDEYAEEYCTIEYDEEDCVFRLIYDGYTERIESLAGLQIVNEDLLEKGAEE